MSLLDFAKLPLPSRQQMEDFFTASSQHIELVRSQLATSIANDQILHNGIKLIIVELRDVKARVEALVSIVEYLTEREAEHVRGDGHGDGHGNGAGTVAAGNGGNGVDTLGGAEFERGDKNGVAVDHRNPAAGGH